MNWQDRVDTYAAAHPLDPRVVAVVTREEYPDPPHGDAYAPAFEVDFGLEWRAHPLDGVYQDEESRALAHRWVEARTKFRWDSGYRYDGLSWAMIERSSKMLHRWLRIFHDADYHVASDLHPDIVLLNTPAWREVTGVSLEGAWWAGDVNDWRSYRDGDVWGVGVLVNLDHTVAFSRDEILPTDEGGGWEFEDGSLVWGHYGLEYAQEEAEDQAEEAAALLARTVPMLGQ